MAQPITDTGPRTRPALWMDEPGTNGRRRIRVGWSAREAGLLAADPAIPSRTVEHWAATGLVGPTVFPHKVWPNHYRDRHARVYGLGDVIAVRLAHDLLERGVDRYVVQEVCATVPGWERRRWRPWRDIAARPGEWMYLIIPDADCVEEVIDCEAPPAWPERVEDLGRHIDEEGGGRLVDTGDGWHEIRYSKEGPMLVHPVGTVAAEVVARVDDWSRRQMGAGKKLAPWL